MQRAPPVRSSSLAALSPTKEEGEGLVKGPHPHDIDAFRGMFHGTDRCNDRPEPMSCSLIQPKGRLGDRTDLTDQTDLAKEHGVRVEGPIAEGAHHAGGNAEVCRRLLDLQPTRRRDKHIAVMKGKPELPQHCKQHL